MSNFIGGGAGDDIISGLGGNDFLQGNGGNDTIDGGAGTADQANYTGIQSEYTVTDNNDGTFTVVDLVAGRDGTDTITGIEVLWFNAGPQSVPISFYANQVLTGTSGSDNLTGSIGHDTISGGDGNDFLTGGKGNDSIDGGDGTNDQANFTGLQSEYNVTDNGDGTFTVVDTVAGRDGVDTLTNVEFLWFNTGPTRPSLASYNDQNLSGTNGTDVIIGALGDDTISGSGGDDFLGGMGGNDIIDGGAGTQDQANYRGALADYTIFDNGDGTFTVADSVAGRDGTDIVTNVEFLWFDIGPSRVSTASYTDQSLTGTAGSDVLSGALGADTIDGGDGNDFLTGGANNDTINGGAGTQDQANYRGAVSEYVITDNGNGSFTIQDTVANRDGTDTLTDVEYLWFDVGPSRIPIATYANQNIVGTAGTDQLTGGVGADTIDGGGGNDFITGGKGDDSINGGSGTDDQANYTGSQAQYTIVDNEDGTYTVTDLVANRDGTDTLTNIEFLWFNTGPTRPAITLYENKTLNGTVGTDFLNGGLGADTINGGDGNDFLTGGGGNDTIDGGAGNNDQVNYTGTQSQYTVTDNGNGSFTVTDLVAGRDGVDVLTNVEFLWFNTGPTRPSINSYTDQTLGGTSGSDTISGALGDDTITGGDGNDFLTGNQGNDFIDGGGGNNDQANYTGPASRYTVANTGPLAVLLDTSATIADVELDALNGGNGNYSGATLTLARNGGAIAEDDFVLNSGGGITVNAAARTISSGGQIIATYVEDQGELAVSFTDANGVAPTTALVNDVIQSIAYRNLGASPPASVQIDYTFDDGNGGSQGSGAGQAVGSVTVQTLGSGGMGTSFSVGSDGDEFFIGTASGDFFDAGAGNDILSGLAGDDDLLGGAGNDVIAGGEGADWLYGGDGDDTFVFGPADGHDTIADFDAGSAGGDSIDVSAFAFADFTAVLASVVQAGADAVLEISGDTSLRLVGVDRTNLDHNDFLV